MVVQTGQPIAQVARDLGINEGTLGNWVHLWKQDHPDPEPEVTEFDREKMARIKAEKATYPVAWMCRLLGVARSSFYAWNTAVEAVTATAAGRARYTELVRKEFTRQRGRAGCRTITALLNSRGHPCSVGFVAAIMRANNLVAVQPRPDKRTTVPGKDPTPATDLIGRDFTPGGVPGTRLVADNLPTNR